MERMHMHRGMGYGIAGRGFVGLKFWILSFVSRKEMTGAQIMDMLEELSIGTWRPSPGNVYPALQQLAAEGFVKSRIENGQKYYSITEKGAAMFSSFAQFSGTQRPSQPLQSMNSSEALRELEGYVTYLEEHASSMGADEKKRLKSLAERLEGLAK